MEVVELWDKVAWWEKLNKKFLKKKVLLIPCMKEGA
jgi:hypothetical protein